MDKKSKEPGSRNWPEELWNWLGGLLVALAGGPGLLPSIHSRAVHSPSVTPPLVSLGTRNAHGIQIDIYIKANIHTHKTVHILKTKRNDRELSMHNYNPST